MKKLIIVFTLLLTPYLGAQDKKNTIDLIRLEKIQKNVPSERRNLVMAMELMNQKLPFSSIPYAAEHIIEAQSIDDNFEKLMEELILKTGPHTLAGVEVKHLARHKSASLSLVLGIKFFQEKSYQNAYKVLNSVPNGHRFEPEALMIQASSLNMLNQKPQAVEKYRACTKLAQDLEDKSKHEKLQRYYAIVKEQCQIHIARISFKEKNYRQAIKEYELISKNSYLWPYLLLERAWAYYYLQDYNRVLGLLVTYRSPLLASYFMPEAEVLSALAYHQMCLHEDTMKTVDQFYQVYKTRSDDLKSILLEHKKSDTYFLQMMLTPIEKVEGQNPFIRNLLTQVRKRVKYSVDIVNYQQARNEFEQWRSLPKHSELSKTITRQVHYQLGWRTKQMNHYVKEQMFGFINDIHRFSYEMFNIRLEVLSKQRDLIYRNQKLADVRSRGSLDNVQRSSVQHFYDFTGEFWADELGDYSFGLQSQCQDAKVVGLVGRK